MWTDIADKTKVFFTRTINHIPFSVGICKSYPSRICYFLLSVKELVWKMMSCKKQRHLCKRTESIPFHWRAGGTCQGFYLQYAFKNARLRLISSQICLLFQSHQLRIAL